MLRVGNCIRLPVIVYLNRLLTLTVTHTPGICTGMTMCTMCTVQQSMDHGTYIYCTQYFILYFQRAHRLQAVKKGEDFSCTVQCTVLAGTHNRVLYAAHSVLLTDSLSRCVRNPQSVVLCRLSCVFKIPHPRFYPNCNDCYCTLEHRN